MAAFLRYEEIEKNVWRVRDCDLSGTAIGRVVKQQGRFVFRRYSRRDFSNLDGYKNVAYFVDGLNKG